MTWVKICGLTNAGDVAATVAAGADAIGFVNVPSSPRFVTREEAADLAAGSPALSILLTLDLAPEQAVAIFGETAIDGVQPYGKYAQETVRAVVEAGGVALYPQPAGSAIECLPGIPLLDAPAGDKLGGTGKTFDWGLAVAIERRFVLAGGLDPDNVTSAIRAVRPWGVDASSRLEHSPGRKDRSMVATFIERAKAT